MTDIIIEGYKVAIEVVRSDVAIEIHAGRGPAGVGAPVSDYVQGLGLLTASQEATLRDILLSVLGDLGGTAPAGRLVVAFAGSSTTQRYFTEFTGFTDNPRVTKSANGSAWAALGGAGAGAQSLGNLLVDALNRDVRFITSGSSGTTVAQWEAAGSSLRSALVAAILAAGKCDVLVFQAGWNDAAAGSVASQAAHLALLRSFVAKVRAETSIPDLKILINGSQRSPFASTDQILFVRQAELLLTADANIRFGAHGYDLAQQDDIHFTRTETVSRHAPRIAQQIVAWLTGANQKRSPKVFSAEIVDSTHTDVNLAFVSGTDFSPTSGIAGLEISLNGGTTWTAATAGVKIDDNTIRFTHAATSGSYMIRMMGNRNALQNAGPYDNTTPTSLPIDPTITPLTLTPAGPPTLVDLTLSRLLSPEGGIWTANIVGRTAGSTITATSSDGTALTVTGSTVSGTFAGAGPRNVTLTETLGSATNSPRTSPSDTVVNSLPLDTFTDANGVLLSNHIADSGHGWVANANNFVIASGRARASAVGVGLRSDYAFPTPNQFVEADMTPLTVIATQIAFLTVRAQANTDTYLYGGYNGSAWIIGRKTGPGTFVPIATVPATLTPGSSYHLRLEAVGTAIKLYVDGALIISITNTTQTISGYGGIGNLTQAGGVSTGIHWDNFTSGPL